jgi:hypothetical protein
VLDLLDCVRRERGVVLDRGRRRSIAAADAGDLVELDLRVVAVALAYPRDLLVGAVQPAAEVLAAGHSHPWRGRGEEVRIERDQSLDLVERAAALA